MADEIAIPEKNADKLRELFEQINSLNAQAQGAVSALALVYDVPDHWQFDTRRMVFVERVAQGAPVVEGEGAAVTAQIAQ